VASLPDLLTVARLPPFLMQPLQGAFTVHERLHELDAAAFEHVAPRIRAICGSGESKVSA
jgi:hydroxypyruvate reductase